MNVNYADLAAAAGFYAQFQNEIPIYKYFEEQNNT